MLYQKIFIASPNDVNSERAVVRAVVDRVRRAKAYQERVNLDIIAWSFPEADLPLDGIIMPKEAIASGIPKPSECDIVVVIFGGRIGMQLPDDYIKPNGSPYLSNTEWEFLDAMDASRQAGGPAVWLYRRYPLLMYCSDDPKYSQQLEQWQKLETFFSSLKNTDDTESARFHAFESSEQFQQQLEKHLCNHLMRTLAA